MIDKIKEVAYHTKTIDTFRKIVFYLKYLFYENKYEFEMEKEKVIFGVDSLTEYKVLKSLDSERPVLEKLIGECRDGDIVWDVGANVGTFTCTISTLKEEVKIISFEPYPPNVDALRKNIELNDVDAEVIDVALADEREKVKFYVQYSGLEGTQQGTTNSNYIEKKYNLNEVKVSTISGDEIIEKGVAPCPDIVKADIEGGAPSMIRGLSGTLENKRVRLLCIEPHNNTDEIIRLMAKSEYDHEKVTLAGKRCDEDDTLIFRPKSY